MVDQCLGGELDTAKRRKASCLAATLYTHLLLLLLAQLSTKQASLSQHLAGLLNKLFVAKEVST